MNPTLRTTDIPDPDRVAVGQPVSRREDPALLRGEGRYTDDLNLPGQAYAMMVRSPVAHGWLNGIDTGAASQMPGVLGIYLAADLKAAGIGPMPANVTGRNWDDRPVAKPAQWALAERRVRYVGDPLAVVVAETANQARDAAEAVLPDIDPLPAVTEAAAAATPGAPVLHDEAPDNVVLDWKFGDMAAVDAVFAGAAHRVELPIRNSRVVVATIEPRAAIGEFDPDGGQWTLRTGCQGTLGMCNGLAAILGAEPGRVRVLSGNVGGSFGMKASVYPEYIAVLHAARQLGRPVKWTADRSESFLADSHGRDHDHTLALALDGEGQFLALRITGFANLGANLSNSTTLPPTMNIVKNIAGVYRTPLIAAAVKCVFTNTTPVGPYRGAGRPEGNYYMERLVDTASRRLGIDRVELRRRNHIRPDQMPYLAASTMEYDSGDFPAILDRALAEADWDGFAARRADSENRGRLRGRGIGQYLEVTAPASEEMGGIRFEADGSVTIVTGTLDDGQGHWTPFAQLLADRLGVPFGNIRLQQGDSDQLIAGGGTGGSRSMMSSGAAVIAASDAVIERGRQIAAHLLQVAVADIGFAAGRFAVTGSDRGIGILELAARLREGFAAPAEVPSTLDVSLVIQGVPSAFPNGCHVAEVEVDPQTGETEVVKYQTVNDFGTLVNPALVAGQVHGGVAQGIGQALYENVRYDQDGQLLSGSFLDYALPRAADVPPLAFVSHPVPATTNELGVKGCGEAGCAGSLPAVMNALVDALSGFGIIHVDMPATPPVVWAAIAAARQERSPHDA
jgi:carbon-monoxide dehydrogenase large subunit